MTDSDQIVYISCVEEVQFSFVSHLSEALYEKGIRDVFVDSKDLSSEEAQEKVERARVAVMVLPGNHRTLFLDKLKKVLKFQKNKDKVVVPVLYGDIPLQDEWHSALDLEGLSSVHRSRKECSDSELVDEIVKDVYEKLFYIERIGIYSKLLEIESMVCKQPFGIYCVGIWGMPGIGKTTLAKAVFDQMLGDFDVSCFIEDYDRAIHEKGLYRLLEDQFSETQPGAGGSITKLSLLSNKLDNKRVLVVLDDVRDPLMAEPLLGGFNWFGPESLIIITSRDKHVFHLFRVNQIYEVQGLNEKEARQLFLLSASIKDEEEQNLHDELTIKVIEHANGNPLALSIYGREFKRERELSEKVTGFLELKRRPPSKIFDAFKSSYDTLNDSEKNIFLDIACFFNGENVDYVMKLLEGCGFFPHVGIDVLAGKSLVTISENRVWMHNLVQDVGREIIYDETGQIQRRSRLWKPWSIKYLLEHKANVESKTAIKLTQGPEAIQGIFLDTSNLSFDIKTTAFENMLNLRLLKIYCSNPEIHPVISFQNGSLHSLPNELRLLHWENYPAKDLPQNFDPRNLVEINMPYSQLETLLSGTKNLEMLRTIRLRHSQKLVDVDVLLKAKNLEVIDLQGCTRLQSFPATGQLLHLRVVNLSGCTEMRNFPEVPPNIERLHLQGTGILKLPIVKPNGGELVSLSEFQGLSDALKLERLTSLEKSSSSNQDLGKLICLELKDCSLLRSLPNMVSLELLKVLDLSGCSELKTIQGFPRNLKELCIAGTAVRKVPQLPQSLELFNAHGCLSLKSIRLDSKKLPMHYTFSNCFKLSPSMLNNFLVESLANAKHIPRERQQELNRALAFSFCSPSHVDQSSTLWLQPGYSVMTRLNPSWRNTSGGFAMLVEVAFSEDYCDATGFGIRCVCRWKNREGRSQRIERNLQCWAPGKVFPKVQNDHIFVFVDVNQLQITDQGNDLDIWADLVVFEFFPASKQTNRLDGSCKVTRCGVRVINAATCNTSLEDISPVLFLDPMDISCNEVEKLRISSSIDNLEKMNKDLFLYIACLFNEEDLDLGAQITAGIELNVGLKVLANMSLISVSSNWEIVMHVFLRGKGKELLNSKMKIERSVDNSQSSRTNHSENLENFTRALPYMPKPTPLGPQVFISFRGEDVRKTFISFLGPALREANINVFIDEDELLGTDLVELLTRIEESAIALVIFSKEYTNSDWCLDELAKIKERKDQGRLKVIPIFYKVEPSVVKHLKGQFGNNFRELKLKHKHEPERTRKWMEALFSIPETKGMPLAEQSDRTDREFIISMVGKIQKLLENMRGDPETEMNRHGGFIIPARQPEREASRQGGSMVYAKELDITHSEDPQRWAWSSINETPDSAAIEVATTIKVYWLKIVGTIKTGDLTPGTKYEAVFVVKLEENAIGWEEPVTLKLKVVQHDGDDNRVDRTENLKVYIGQNWVDILAGVFVVPPKNTPATVIFTMYQYNTDFKRRGLIVKGVAIRPTN